MVKRQPIEKNNKDKFLDQINFSLADQDYQIKMVQFADNKYQNKEISLDEYIKFWETLWERTGLIFEGVGWRFELAHLYILANRLEDALTFVKFIKSKSDSYYSAKADWYISDITRRMKKKVSLKKAGSYYFVGTLFNKGIGFLTVPIFTRILTVSDYGIVTSGASIY